MKHEARRRVILLGLDDGLLWQLTRVLAAMEDEIEYYPTSSISEAGDLLKEKDVILVIVDGAEMGMRVLQTLPAGDAHSLPRLLVLTEGSFQSLPQEMLLPDETLFLEKPFNPKEFPFFVSKALEGSVASYPAPELRSDENMVAKSTERTEDRHKDFYYYFDQGLVCISRRDLAGARESWLQALSLRPEDKSVRANLARLEKMINKSKE